MARCPSVVLDRRRRRPRAVACGRRLATGRAPSAASRSGGSWSSRRVRAPPSDRVKLTVGLGYIPNVQFAPFYLAAAGRLLRGRGPRGRRSRTRSTRTSSRSSARAPSTSGISDGTSVIPAVSQGIPIQYIATIYGKFPSIVFAKASSGIKTRGRPEGQEDRHPGPLRLVLDHAPGAARLGRADARRPRRSSSTRTSGRAPRSRPAPSTPRRASSNNEPVAARADRRRRRRCSTSTRSPPLPGPGLIVGDHDDRVEARRGRRVRAGDAQGDGARSRRTRRSGWTPRSRPSPELRPRTGPRRRSSTPRSTRGPGRSRRLAASARSTPQGWKTSIDYLASLGLTKAPVTVEQVVRTDLLPPHQ